MSTKALAQFLPTLVVSLTVVTTSLLYYWFRNRKNFVKVCKIKKLFIYPVKALKGIEVNRLEITGDVVKYGKFKDRSWVLLDRDDQWIGIKHEPKLALTKCTFHNDSELWVEAPNMPVLKLTYIEDLNNCQIMTFKFYGKEIKGIDCGEEVHNWFRTYLGKPGLRLAQHHNSFQMRDNHTNDRRSDDKDFKIIYQNKAGLHLVNQSSVKDLNSHISDKSQPIVYHNFRPNVLVDYDKAWEEDMWKYMSINGVKFVRLLKCDRCPSTTVNPNTGFKGQETLIALKKFRPAVGMSKKKGLGPNFGVIFGPLSQGFINTGDQIEAIYGEYDVK